MVAALALCIINNKKKLAVYRLLPFDYGFCSRFVAGCSTPPCYATPSNCFSVWPQNKLSLQAIDLYNKCRN